MAMLAVCAVTVSACSHDEKKPVIRVYYPSVTIPDSARRPCDQPSDLPDRDMTSREVTSKWGADRAALLTCETKRAAAVAAVDATEKKP